VVSLADLLLFYTLKTTWSTVDIKIEIATVKKNTMLALKLAQ